MPRRFRFNSHPIMPNGAHRQSLLQTPSQRPPSMALLNMVLRELATSVNLHVRHGTGSPGRYSDLRSDGRGVKGAAQTTIYCRKSENQLGSSHDQSCSRVPKTEGDLAGPASAKEGLRKKFPRFIPRNPLISLDSDERIQGNPRESKSHKRGSSQRNGRDQENPNRRDKPRPTASERPEPAPFT
jgi:hypothetical protein